MSTAQYNARMWYVFVLSGNKKKDLFIGIDEDLDHAMAEHATGMHDETAGMKDLKCESYIGVAGKKQALNLAKYLQSKEGMAMVKKFFL